MRKNLNKSAPIRSSEITPEHLYHSRREFIKKVGMIGAGLVLGTAISTIAGCQPAPTALPPSADDTITPVDPPAAGPAATATTAVRAPAGSETDELGDPLTPFEAITNYNNFYEFTTDKADVAVLARDFKTSPWQVEIGGLVNNPMTLDFEDLLSKYTQEERIYRLRCVEGWSMVIPWQGFPLYKLLKEVEPKAEAKYVRFVTLFDPDQMPGQKSRFYPWPYQEGLRLDEAMHDLTILSTGLYGKTLLPQSGAPLRLVVPWKYGFKSIKSIVKIELVENQPETLWSTVASHEYGFYSNVNPEKAHPRWSQASERRIGELSRRPTLMFNGYAGEVAHLYKDMNLNVYY